MAYAVLGEQRAFHPITVQFDGPTASETGPINPFTDYRLNVTFTEASSGQSYVVPGYFAADGDAADTSATAGDIWEVRFTPPTAGTWEFDADFRQGDNIATSFSPTAGAAAAFDGETGNFEILESDKSVSDFRGRGILSTSEDGRYLHFAPDDPFLKTGAGSPENFLAYTEFDGTYDHQGNFLHRYELHRADYDPASAQAYTWQGGQGDEILGALRYLHEQDLNGIYVITDTTFGDGDDVWPWTGHTADDWSTFDVSKLAQWQRVFDYAQTQGIHVDLLFNETENVLTQNGGDLGFERQLYYREMLARFGHLNAVTYNISEETKLSAAQSRTIAEYLDTLDPYDRPVVTHTFPGDKAAVFTPLLGFEPVDGASLQTGPDKAHSDTLRWIDNAREAGTPWFASYDENAPARYGVTLDDAFNQDDVDPRSEQDAYMAGVWGHFMAGGTGAMAYFGYDNTEYTVQQLKELSGIDTPLVDPGQGTNSGDLDTEWWGVREDLWEQMAAARAFFEDLPLQTMQPDDTLLPQNTGLARYSFAIEDHALAAPGELYALYLQNGSEGGNAALRIDVAGIYDIQWYDPRSGAHLDGDVTTIDVANPGVVELGSAPHSSDSPWAVLVERIDETTDEVTPAALELTLIDATTGDEVSALVDGTVVDLGATDAPSFTVTAASESSEIESVEFELTGPIERTQLENVPAYALFGGDGPGSFGGEALPAGSYTLTATPYAEDGGAGPAGTPITAEFTVIEGVAAAPSAPADTSGDPQASSEEPAELPPPPSDAVVFDALTPTSGQDEDTAVALADDGTIATLSGNTWVTQALPTALAITADTVARFQMAIDDLGEIQGIGFDDDAGWSLGDPFQALFKLAGFQDDALSVDESLEDTVALGDGFVEVTIALDAFAGEMLSHVHLINDQDDGISSQMSLGELVIGDADTLVG